MDIPFIARFTLLVAVILNVAASSLLERWELLGKVVYFIDKQLRSRRSYRSQSGKVYKAVEGAMN
jgi:cation-transporting ATPase 13A2